MYTYVLGFFQQVQDFRLSTSICHPIYKGVSDDGDDILRDAYKSKIGDISVRIRVYDS